MKRNWFISGSILLVLVSIAGAILIQSKVQQGAALAQELVQNPKAEKILAIAVERNIDGEITSGEVQVSFEDPANLPKEGESVFGVFIKQEDDVITVGTGSIEVEVDVEVVNDEEPVRTVHVSNTGPSVEIQVTPATVIFADITPEPEISDADLVSGSKLVTRTIIPGSFEAIGDGMILRVWGPVQDGMVTAEVLVFETID